MFSGFGLSISAISQGVAGQLSMGPHDSSTDAWEPGMSAAEKVSFEVSRVGQRIVDSAVLSALHRHTVRLL